MGKKLQPKNNRSLYKYSLCGVLCNCFNPTNSLSLSLIQSFSFRTSIRMPVTILVILLLVANFRC